MRPLLVVRYLLVPLGAAPLLAILFFAVSLTFAEHAGLFGIALFFGIAWLLITYGFALLEHVLDGRSHPLPLSLDVRSAYATPTIGTLLLVCTAYSATGGLRRWLDPDVIDALRLSFLGLFPAMIGVMSMTGRFSDALNPLPVLHTIRRIPVTYAVLVCVIVMLWTVPLLFVRATGFSFDALWRPESFFPLGMLPTLGLRGALIGLLGHVVMAYLWLATFACIGGALYESRQDLDFEPAESPERKAERTNVELERQRDLVMDRLFWESRGGTRATAHESIRKLLAQAPRPIEECRWLYLRAARFEDQQLANYLAQLLLPLLLAERANGEALETVRQRLAVSAHFRPLTDTQLSGLVELARAAGDRATAKRLLANTAIHP
jgi:hypothetical protein